MTTSDNPEFGPHEGGINHSSSYTNLSVLSDRFAFLQEAINYEIYLREAGKGELTVEEWLQYHRELQQIGDSEEARDFDFDAIKVTMGQFELSHIQKDLVYSDWLRIQDTTDPADF